jgi:hypothetical protein
VALFAAIILAPATAYLYLAYPDWSWLYLVDAGHVPRLMVIPVVAAGAGALAAGYYGAARLLRVARRRTLPALLAGAAGVALLVGLLLRGRLLSAGSYGEFHAGRAVPLADVKLGYALAAVLVGVGAAALVVAWELWRDGRRVALR